MALKVHGITGIELEGGYKVEAERMEKARQGLLELLEMNVKAIVDLPDQVEVKMRQGEQTTVFEIYSAREDVGKVLGKKGSTANALRRLVTAFSCRHRFRAVVEIIE